MNNLLDSINHSTAGVIYATAPAVAEHLNTETVTSSLHLFGVIIVAIMQVISLFKKNKN